MKPRIEIGDWPSQRLPAQALRREVFIVEQNIPVELEWDDMDAVSVHAVAYEENEPVATGRLLPDAHIGRMAVRKGLRGKGIGSAVLRSLMEHARKRGDRAVILHAQLSAEEFYARHGFVREGEVFMEADIPHVRMVHAFG